ncbi:hypothetical protein Goklo_016343, partial [Gossypium klotzschianum]|nr:hypothetical protein [Gossypium klotzschianum]
AWKNWNEGTALEVVDPILRDGSRSEITRCIQLGLLCVQEDTAYRPTMASAVLMLSSYSKSFSAIGTSIVYAFHQGERNEVEVIILL